jgi:hypothetical protein
MSQKLTPMLEALGSDGRNRGLADQLELYGRLIGSWRLDVDFYFHNGTHLRTDGEAHFEWVLEGHAIQDVFIIPARGHRGGARQPWWRYGSTVRWYDPTIDAWRITFFDPPRRVELHQLARAVDDEIVQIGEDSAGLWRRWRFVQIESSAFRWLGEVSWDRGATWTRELEFHGGRTA